MLDKRKKYQIRSGADPGMGGPGGRPPLRALTEQKCKAGGCEKQSASGELSRPT